MELSKSSHFVIDGFYNKTFYDFFQTKYNMHAAFEIMYVTSGSSEVRVMMRDETKHEQKHLLTKDMFILIGPNQIHQLLTHDKCRILHIEFVYSSEFNPSLNFLQLLRRNRATAELLSDKFTYAVCRGDYRVLDIIKAIHQECDNNAASLNREDSLFNLQILLADLLANVAKCIHDEKKEQKFSSVYVNRAIEYIHHNYQNSELGVDALVAYLNINRTYLQKLFKSKTRKTIVEYINCVRVNHAKTLLKMGAMSVIDIGFEVGFNNRQNFYVTFKKYVGESPNEYRQKMAHREVEIFNETRVNQEIDDRSIEHLEETEWRNL